MSENLQLFMIENGKGAGAGADLKYRNKTWMLN